MTMTLEELKALIPAAYIYANVTKAEADVVPVDKFYVDQFGTMYLGVDSEQPQLANKLVTA